MTSDGSAAPETITLLQDVRGRPLTKSFRRVGSWIVKGSYPNASEFRAFEVEVDGIASLATVLGEVATDGHAALIRGAPGRFYPRNGAPAFRLLQPQEGLASARTGARISQQQIRLRNLQPDDEHRWAVIWLPTFQDRARRWVILDVDRVRAPDHLADDWIDEPEAAVEHVLALLPEPFRTATCWWSISSSAAVPGPSGREISRTSSSSWRSGSTAAARHPGQAVDGRRTGSGRSGRVRRRAADLHRPPGFAHGLHDPVPRRSGIWQGEADSVAVPDLLPEPKPQRYGSAAAFGPVEGLEELCDGLRRRLAGELHVREHLLQAARAYVCQHGPNIDQAALVEALEGIALEYRTQGEVATYGVDRLVAYVVQQERAATWMPFGRPPRPARLKPYFGPEGSSLLGEFRKQKAFLRGWMSRQHVYALARREIANRRAAAFAAEGLA